MGMAYFGTTAASSLQNPPRAIQPTDIARIGTTVFPVAARLWLYGSTDTSSAPFSAGYFVDADKIGMKQGDIVIYAQQASTVGTSQVLGLGIVSSVSTTGGGACLSTHSFISST